MPSVNKYKAKQQARVDAYRQMMDIRFDANRREAQARNKERDVRKRGSVLQRVLRSGPAGGVRPGFWENRPEDFGMQQHGVMGADWTKVNPVMTKRRANTGFGIFGDIAARKIEAFETAYDQRQAQRQFQAPAEEERQPIRGQIRMERPQPMALEPGDRLIGIGGGTQRRPIGELGPGPKPTWEAGSEGLEPQSQQPKMPYIGRTTGVERPWSMEDVADAREGQQGSPYPNAIETTASDVPERKTGNGRQASAPRKVRPSGIGTYGMGRIRSETVEPPSILFSGQVPAGAEEGAKRPLFAVD